MDEEGREEGEDGEIVLDDALYSQRARYTYLTFPFPTSLPPSLPPSLPCDHQKIDKMQAQIASMHKDGAFPKDDDRPAFNIDSKTEGYCGLCNVPG